MDNSEKIIEQLLEDIEREPELARAQLEDEPMQQIGATLATREKFYSVCNKHRISIDVRIGFLNKIIQWEDLKRALNGYPSNEDRLDYLRKINRLAKNLIELQTKQQEKNIRQDRLRKQLEDNTKNLNGLLKSIKRDKYINGDKGDMECLSNWLFIISNDLKKWLDNPSVYAQEIADRTDAAIKTHSHKGHPPPQSRRWLADYIHDIFVLCCSITPTTTTSGPFVEILAAVYNLLLNDEEKACQLAFEDARECIQVRKYRTELTS